MTMSPPPYDDDIPEQPTSMAVKFSAEEEQEDEELLPSSPNGATAFSRAPGVAVGAPGVAVFGVALLVVTNEWVVVVVAGSMRIGVLVGEDCCGGCCTMTISDGIGG